MDRDAIWRALLNEAIQQTPCTAGGKTCWLNIRHTPWYASFQHGDRVDHACGICNPYVLPTHIVSVEALQVVKRADLVARLARWARHAHEIATDSGIAVDAPGTDRSAVDGRLPADASAANGAAVGVPASDGSHGSPLLPTDAGC